LEIDIKKNFKLVISPDVCLDKGNMEDLNRSDVIHGKCLNQSGCCSGK
jgi:hypothetical protein